MWSIPDITGQRGRRHWAILRATRSTTLTEFLTVTQAVDFYEVHRLVTPILAQVETWPAAGTLPWNQLRNTDPAKWAAVLDAARYGVLQMQLRQEALADASREIACAADWAALAQRIHNGRGAAYIERKKSA